MFWKVLEGEAMLEEESHSGVFREFLGCARSQIALYFPCLPERVNLCSPVPTTSSHHAAPS